MQIYPLCGLLRKRQRQLALPDNSQDQYAAQLPPPAIDKDGTAAAGQREEKGGGGDAVLHTGDTNGNSSTPTAAAAAAAAPPPPPPLLGSVLTAVHAEHYFERFGLMCIIVLGEGISQIIEVYIRT